MAAPNSGRFEPALPEDPFLCPQKASFSGIQSFTVWGPALAMAPIACVQELSTGTALLLGVGWITVASLGWSVIDDRRIHRIVRRVPTLMAAGRVTDARSLLSDSIRRWSARGSMILPLVWSLAWVDLSRGALDSAQRTFAVLPRYRGYRGRIAAIAPSVVALIYALRGDRAAAEHGLQEASSKGMDVAIPYSALTRLVLTCLEGRWDQALEMHHGEWPTQAKQLGPPLSWLSEWLGQLIRSRTSGVQAATGPKTIPLPPTGDGFTESEWPQVLSRLESAGAGLPGADD